MVKRITLPLLVLLAGIACASNVIFYNPTSVPVAGRIVSYQKSFDTGLLAGMSNYLVNPLVPTNALGFLRESNGLVVVMSPDELTQITNFNNALIATNLILSRSNIRSSLLSIYGPRTQDSNPHDVAIAIGFEVMGEQLLNQINILRTNAGLGTITTNQMFTTLRTAITNKVLAIP